MAISTYSELQTAMANWLKRTDQTARIPEFIELAEARLRRKLRTYDTESVVNMDVDSEYEDIPTGVLEASFIILNTSPPTNLQFLTPSQLVGRYQGKAGKPLAYTRIGSQYRFGPIPDGGYTADVISCSFIPLSDGAPTNWVLTDHPDLYLYGALIHAEPFMRNDARATTWAALYSRAEDELDEADFNSALSNPTIRAD